MGERFTFFELGVTPEQLVGYAYAGLFASLCFAFVNPDEVRLLIESLGTVSSLLVVLGLGIGIYALYFKFLGEFVLWPTVHIVHDWCDAYEGLRGERRTSVVGYLELLGAPARFKRGSKKGQV